MNFNVFPPPLGTRCREAADEGKLYLNCIYLNGLLTVREWNLYGLPRYPEIDRRRIFDGKEVTWTSSISV